MKLMGALRELEGSPGGTGGSLCLSSPQTPEPAGPQHPSSGRVQVGAGEVSSASPGAARFPPAGGQAVPTRAPSTPRGEPDKSGPRGTPGGAAGVPAPPARRRSGLWGPLIPAWPAVTPRRFAQEEDQDDLGDFSVMIGTDFTVSCPDQMTLALEASAISHLSGCSLRLTRADTFRQLGYSYSLYGLV